MKIFLIISISLCISLLCFSMTAYSQTLAANKNPYEGNASAVNEGRIIFQKNCEGCHGVAGKGDICPNLTDKEWKYGNSNANLFLTISKGRPGGMPNWEYTLGADKIWKVISYIRSIERK